MFKYLSSLFLAVALLFAAQAPAQTFAHYVGASGKPLASNGMQQVAEYNYNIYVTSKTAPNMEAYNGSNFLLLSFLSKTIWPAIEITLIQVVPILSRRVISDGTTIGPT